MEGSTIIPEPDISDISNALQIKGYRLISKLEENSSFTLFRAWKSEKGDEVLLYLIKDRSLASSIAADPESFFSVHLPVAKISGSHLETPPYYLDVEPFMGSLEQRLSMDDTPAAKNVSVYTGDFLFQAARFVFYPVRLAAHAASAIFKPKNPAGFRTRFYVNTGISAFIAAMCIAFPQKGDYGRSNEHYMSPQGIMLQHKDFIRYMKEAPDSVHLAFNRHGAIVVSAISNLADKSRYMAFIPEPDMTFEAPAAFINGRIWCTGTQKLADSRLEAHNVPQIFAIDTRTCEVFPEISYNDSLVAEFEGSHISRITSFFSDSLNRAVSARFMIENDEFCMTGQHMIGTQCDDSDNQIAYHSKYNSFVQYPLHKQGFNVSESLNMISFSDAVSGKVSFCINGSHPFVFAYDCMLVK